MAEATSASITSTVTVAGARKTSPANKLHNVPTFFVFWIAVLMLFSLASAYTNPADTPKITPIPGKQIPCTFGAPLGSPPCNGPSDPDPEPHPNPSPTTEHPQPTTTSAKSLSSKQSIPIWFLMLATIFAILPFARATTNSVDAPAITPIQGQQIPCVFDAPAGSPPRRENGPEANPTSEMGGNDSEAPETTTRVATGPHPPAPDTTVILATPPPPPCSGVFKTLIPFANSPTFAPHPATSDAEGKRVRFVKNPIALMCLCLLGSLCYNLGLWKDVDEEKPEKKAKKKKKSKDDKTIEAHFVGEQELGEIVHGVDVKKPS